MTRTFRDPVPPRPSAIAIVLFAAVSSATLTAAQYALAPQDDKHIDPHAQVASTGESDSAARTRGSAALPETEAADYSVVFPDMIGGPEPNRNPERAREMR